MKIRVAAVLAILAAFALALRLAADSPKPAQDMQGMEHSALQMSGHMEMSAHMRLTSLRAKQPGDDERAAQVVAAARRASERYRDYKTALADGFQIFLPNVPQPMYHFTNYRYAIEAAFAFNPEHPTSLLYEKQSNGGYKLIGVMYTARKAATEADLDQRIPLSIAQWHAHTNYCKPPDSERADMLKPNARFGLRGTITTREECEKAGGTFMPQVFGWMVHVYPDEKDAAAIWSVERQMEHGDHDHMH
jgi:hypothetical protein